MNSALRNGRMKHETGLTETTAKSIRVSGPGHPNDGLPHHFDGRGCAIRRAPHLD